jgi:hypothetical protein
MEVDAWAIFPRNDSKDMREKRIENFLSFIGPGGFSTPDDVAAFEGCQRGFQAFPEKTWSDISRGMGRNPINTDELQMRVFWRKWAAMMSGENNLTDFNDHPERVKESK